MERSAAARANDMAAKAEEYALKGLWGRSAKAHLQAAALYKDAMQEATDAEVLKTLELLHTNHVRRGRELTRRHQLTDTTSPSSSSILSTSSSAAAAAAVAVSPSQADLSTTSSTASLAADASTVGASRPESRSSFAAPARTASATSTGNRPPQPPPSARATPTQSLLHTTLEVAAPPAARPAATETSSSARSSRRGSQSSRRESQSSPLRMQLATTPASRLGPHENTAASIDQSYFLMGSGAHNSYHADRLTQPSPLPPQPARSLSTNEAATVAARTPPHIFGLHGSGMHGASSSASSPSYHSTTPQPVAMSDGQNDANDPSKAAAFPSFWDVIDSLVAKISNASTPNIVASSPSASDLYSSPPQPQPQLQQQQQPPLTRPSVLPPHMSVAESYFMVPNSLGESYLRPQMPGPYTPAAATNLHPQMLTVRQQAFPAPMSLLSIQQQQQQQLRESSAQNQDLVEENRNLKRVIDDLTKQRLSDSPRSSQMSTGSFADSQSRRSTSYDDRDVDAESLTSVDDNEKEVLRKRVEELEGFVSRLMTDKTRSEAMLQAEKDLLVKQVAELRRREVAAQQRLRVFEQQSQEQAAHVQNMQAELEKERELVHRYRLRWEKLKETAKRKQQERESVGSTSITPPDDRSLHTLLTSGELARSSQRGSSAASSTHADHQPSPRPRTLSEMSLEDAILPLQERLGRPIPSTTTANATPRRSYPPTADPKQEPAAAAAAAAVGAPISPVFPGTPFLAYSPPVSIQRSLLRHSQAAAATTTGTARPQPLTLGGTSPQPTATGQSHLSPRTTSPSIGEQSAMFYSVNSLGDPETATQ